MGQEEQGRTGENQDGAEGDERNDADDILHKWKAMKSSSPGRLDEEKSSDSRIVRSARAHVCALSSKREMAKDTNNCLMDIVRSVSNIWLLLTFYYWTQIREQDPVRV